MGHLLSSIMDPIGCETNSSKSDNIENERI